MYTVDAKKNLFCNTSTIYVFFLLLGVQNADNDFDLITPRPRINEAVIRSNGPTYPRAFCFRFRSGSTSKIPHETNHRRLFTISRSFRGTSVMIKVRSVPVLDMHKSLKKD
jgi:hypothetical protein